MGKNWFFRFSIAEVCLPVVFPQQLWLCGLGQYGFRGNAGAASEREGSGTRFRKVLGQVLEEGSGGSSGALFPEQVLGQVPKEVPGSSDQGGFQGGSGWVPGSSRQGSRRDVPERFENDLVADGGTGFRDGSLGEPVAVALVPALVLVWIVVVTDDSRCHHLSGAVASGIFVDHYGYPKILTIQKGDSPEKIPSFDGIKFPLKKI